MNPPSSISFSHQQTEGDIIQLKSSLSNVFELVGIGKRTNARILNLACGRADESGVLMDLLSSNPALSELIGIDIRAREIAEANERWRREINANFLVHDGTKLNDIQQFNDGFDYAFMRHQNFWNGDLTWHRIYDRALHLLKPDGYLIITSYFGREHLLALQAIQSLGANLLTTWKNPRTRLIDEKIKKSTDRHIAVFSL